MASLNSDGGANEKFLTHLCVLRIDYVPAIQSTNPIAKGNGNVWNNLFFLYLCWLPGISSSPSRVHG